MSRSGLCGALLAAALASGPAGCGDRGDGTDKAADELKAQLASANQKRQEAQQALTAAAKHNAVLEKQLDAAQQDLAKPANQDLADELCLAKAENKRLVAQIAQLNAELAQGRAKPPGSQDQTAKADKPTASRPKAATEKPPATRRPPVRKNPPSAAKAGSETSTVNLAPKN